nr:uncharacterized protein LOC121469036 isoform X4 [Taeniopygia guttata]
MPSHPIPSHPIPWGHAHGQDGIGAGQTPHSRAPCPGAARGCPCLGSAGLGCVLRPLPQPLSSGCARSLPGAAVQRTREQERTRGRFRRTAQMVCKFMKRIREEESSVVGTVVRAYSPIFKTKTSAALLDMLVEEGPSSPKQSCFGHVEEHHVLAQDCRAGHARTPRGAGELARAQHVHLRWGPHGCPCPGCEFLPLLAPRPPLQQLSILPPPRRLPASGAGLKPGLGAASGPPGPVLPLRCSPCVSPGLSLPYWALPHGHLGTERCLGLLCPLQATVVMWKILQLPCVPHVVTVCFPCLFVHLLFQVLFSTLDMPEEVDTFWKGCQQQHGLATNPSSFAEQTLKALLCRLHYEDVVVAMEDKGGWDTLLCADTHHCAVGVLAREMRRASEAVCSAIAFQLLGLLSKDTPCRDLAALAFLVEVLERLNLSECRDSVLEFLSKNLQSECRGRRRLALRGLVVLGTTSASMARRMWSLHERLVELLQENDGVMLRMTTVLLRAVFLCKEAPVTSTLALQLAEALLPLFDNEDSQVQLSSMFIFRDMLDRFPEEEKKALKAHVRQSLLPLSFHCHDENQRVAEASQETLLCAAEFLKQRDLEKLLKNQKLWKFTECLLAEDSSSVAEHLRRALPYLQSPQEPLREAAVRFMGTAGRYLRGRKEELQLISEALEGMANDISVPVGSLAVQTLYVLQEAERAPYSIFDNLHDRLRRAWRRRPRLSGLGWLRCWSSAES